MNHSRRSAVRVRTLGAAVVLGATLALSGCGFGAQTLQTYTPAHGVNVDDGGVKVRNLLVVADERGQGVLSGAFATDVDDTLTRVAGTALDASGADSGVLTVTGGPVPLKRNGLAVLTSASSPIQVSSPAMKPGLLARVDLQFASGRATTVTVPVISATDPIYASVAPLLTPSPTPTPTPEATATPAPAATPAATPAG